MPGYDELQNAAQSFDYSQLAQPTDKSNKLNMVSKYLLDASGAPNMPQQSYADTTNATNITPTMAASMMGMAIPQLRPFEATGAIGTMGAGMANVAERMGQGTLVGGAANTLQDNGQSTGQNFTQGAMETAPMMGLGELVGAPFRATRLLAQMVNPTEFAGKIGDAIKSTYQAAADKSKAIYQDLMGRHGTNDIEPTQYSQQYDKWSDYLNPEIKTRHNNFMDDPTYKNAQSYQSFLGQKLASLRQSSAPDYDKITAIKSLRDSLVDGDIKNYFWNAATENPELYHDSTLYNEARGIRRDVVEPVNSNNFMDKVVSGRKESIDPMELQKQMLKMRESGELPQNHFINDYYDPLVKRNQLADLGRKGLTGLAALGGYMGGVSDIPEAAIAGHFGGKALIEAAQNPLLEKMFQRLGYGMQRALPTTAMYNSNSQ